MAKRKGDKAMAEHTALPWRVETHIDPDGTVETHGVLAPSGERVIETDMGFYPPGIVDARFIVRAANNFEALLAAAKVSLAELKDFVITAENMLGGKRVTLHSIALLEAAIAEAEKAE